MIYVPTHDNATTLRVLSSVSRFFVLPETMGMRDWLKDELRRLDEANRIEMDPDVFRQRQGACQVLQALFRIADEADRTIDKIRANQRKP